MVKDIIMADDSGLLKAVRHVITEDTRREREQAEANYQKGKRANNLTLTETVRAIAEDEQEADIASQRSLKSYPADNANSFPSYGKPDFENVDLYFGDKEGVSPRIEPNIDRDGDAKSLQRQLIDATRAVAAVWSRIVDTRRRLNVNDVKACRAYLKTVLGALVDSD